LGKILVRELLLFLNRQIMYIDMARQTVREQFHLFLIVWFTMTFCTTRNFTMCLMALGADYLTVLALRSLPLGVNFIMTSAAALNVNIDGEIDPQRRMHPLMASHTTFNRLPGIMTIMAFRAIRDVAMFLMVAALASLFRVSTRKLFKFTCWPRMTISTRLGKPIHSRNAQRSMRILMTVNTVDLHRSMLLAMTHSAERHQIVIIVFSRIVRMKDFVAFLTGKAMFAAGVF